jgi:hypothetical protein
MKSIVILLFIVGVVMVLAGYTRQYSICPNPKIEYRYIPRTFYDEQLSSQNVLKQFGSMFQDENPWIMDRNINNPENVNTSNFYKKVDS